MAKRILFAASEAYPLIKTGGLADVAGSLPRALLNSGDDIRLVLPAYKQVLDKETTAHPQCEVTIGDKKVRILLTTLPGSRVKTWLVDYPAYFSRPGNPYLGPDGLPWPDNAFRFALFCRVITMLANDQCGLDWVPDVVHLNDWQTGLAAAMLAEQDQSPPAIFTIHNLAYQGLFDYQTFVDLELEEQLWHFEKLEFHGQLSFMKAGLVYADRITTVSPTYAKEIQTAEFGCGLEGLLLNRKSHLSGIINGIDTREWNPGTDEFLIQPYNRSQLRKKQLNKLVLQKTYGLKRSEDTMVMGLVSRLVYQKGIDMLIEILPDLMRQNVQLVLLGTGDPGYEETLKKLASVYPGYIGVKIGYDEALAHQIEAGSDVFLMPSRFEPCGLNQMYSQRYGTLPIVTPVGGLVDTVTDTTEMTILDKTATGFVMKEVSYTALMESIRSALMHYRQLKDWLQLQRNAMSQDFSWKKSAAMYRDLYNQI